MIFNHYIKGDYERVFELKEDILRTIGRRFRLRTCVRGLTLVSHAYANLGRWDEAVELGKEVLSTAQEYRDESMVAWAASMIAAVYVFKRDLNQARTHVELALGKAPTLTDRVLAETFLGWHLCHAGEPHRGTELLAGILPIYEGVRMLFLEIWCALFLAEGYWLAGDYDKGRQTAQKLLKTATLAGARYGIGYAHLLLGEMSLDTELIQAATFFKKSITVLQEIKAENALAMAYAGCGRLHKRKGDAEQARKYLIRPWTSSSVSAP